MFTHIIIKRFELSELFDAKLESEMAVLWIQEGSFPGLLLVFSLSFSESLKDVRT